MCRSCIIGAHLVSLVVSIDQFIVHAVLSPFTRHITLLHWTDVLYFVKALEDSSSSCDSFPER